MKVILLKDWGKLGKAAATVKVKDGFARNFLIPQGYALMASEKSFNQLEQMKKKRAKLAEKEKESYLKLKQEIEKISLTIAVEAKENDELYGSVNQTQILKALSNEGIDLDKDKLILEAAIERVGVYNLKVAVGSQVEANLRVWVVRK